MVLARRLTECRVMVKTDSLYVFFGVEIEVFHAPIGYKPDICY